MQAAERKKKLESLENAELEQTERIKGSKDNDKNNEDESKTNTESDGISWGMRKLFYVFCVYQF